MKYEECTKTTSFQLQFDTKHNSRCMTHTVKHSDVTSNIEK